MPSIVGRELSNEDLHKLSTLSLAHIGDAVYELMVRTWLICQGVATSKTLHRETVRRVKAEAQAVAAQSILQMLSESERQVFMRGRNAKPTTRSRSSSAEDYQSATALEALFGYLYLTGKTDRLNDFLDIIVSVAPNQ